MWEERRGRGERKGVGRERWMGVKKGGEGKGREPYSDQVLRCTRDFPSIYLSIHPSIYLSIHPPIHPSISTSPLHPFKTNTLPTRNRTPSVLVSVFVFGLDSFVSPMSSHEEKVSLE